MINARGTLAGLSLLLVATAGCSAPAQTTTSVPGTTAASTPASSASAPTSTAATTRSASTSTGASATTASAAPSRVADAANQTLVTATTKDVSFTDVKAPATLADDLRKGGYVIVFRYTGAGGPDSPVPASLQGKVKDDGQRISDNSVQRMKAYGDAYRKANIPVNRVLSSEYYFVWQHANAAFGDPIAIHRDLTGSLDFSDQGELERSLQGLRDRTVTPPDQGSNTVLFTHQGKFDKAYGFYPDAGTTIIFRPDGSGTPRVVAVMDYEEFMTLVG